MKIKRLKIIALFIKGFMGTAGIASVMADYKWVGLSLLLIGAAADGILYALKNYENEESISPNNRS